MPSSGIDRRAISAATLKHTALALMVLNHFFLRLSLVTGETAELYDFQELVTRGSFVLFAFLIAEGMVHTRNRWRYFLRLLALGVISEPFYDFVLWGKMPYWIAQNVFFTLALAVLAVLLADRFRREKPILAVGSTALVMAAASLSLADYGLMGVGLVLVFYYLRERRALCLLAAAAAIFVLWFFQLEIYNLEIAPIFSLSYCLKNAAVELCGILVFPLIWLYDGSRGKQLPKAFYYFFYPCHLALIYLVLLAV